MKAHKNKSFFLINALIIFGFISFQILNIENPHISLGKYNASFFYTGGSPAGKLVLLEKVIEPSVMQVWLIVAFLLPH